MAEIKALDLSEVKVVPVRLGNRDFRITQDKRAVLQKVVELAFSERKDADERSWGDMMLDNWDTSLDALCLILGCGEDTEARAFLEEHVTVSKALAIFDAWWDLNEMEHFLARGGRMSIPPSLTHTLEEKKQKETIQ